MVLDDPLEGKPIRPDPAAAGDAVSGPSGPSSPLLLVATRTSKPPGSPAINASAPPKDPARNRPDKIAGPGAFGKNQMVSSVRRGRVRWRPRGSRRSAEHLIGRGIFASSGSPAERQKATASSACPGIWLRPICLKGSGPAYCGPGTRNSHAMLLQRSPAPSCGLSKRLSRWLVGPHVRTKLLGDAAGWRTTGGGSPESTRDGIGWARGGSITTPIK